MVDNDAHVIAEKLELFCHDKFAIESVRESQLLVTLLGSGELFWPETLKSSPKFGQMCLSYQSCYQYLIGGGASAQWHF